MSGIVHHIHNRLSKAQDTFHEHIRPFAKSYDLSIQFIGASGLPKMDVIGSCDPYFIAKLDDKISYTSTVQPRTLKPVWNETWNVRNVPSTATLTVEVFDKDDGLIDDYIGKFTTSVTAGAKECEIDATLVRARGSFWLKINSDPSEDDAFSPYTFDGPIRYTVHRSPTLGRLTSLNDERLYSTWKMYIKGVSKFFGDTYQPWNRDYKAAQAIFQGPASIAVRAGIQAGHRLLYARNTTNAFGIIDSPADTLSLLQGGKSLLRGGHRVKPAVYTYVLSADDATFRFSETGAAFLVDFASKHALHSNCAESVRYSGEFHPRPRGGWENFNDDIPDEQVQWELVIDNNSGTYSPNSSMLPCLKQLLEYNFPHFGIFSLDYKDPELERSREACRAYAIAHRGVRQTELQPHVQGGEESLMHQAIQQS